MSPGTTDRPESVPDKLAGILSVSIVANDYDKGIVMDIPDTILQEISWILSMNSATSTRMSEEGTSSRWAKIQSFTTCFLSKALWKNRVSRSERSEISIFLKIL